MTITDQPAVSMLQSLAAALTTSSMFTAAFSSQEPAACIADWRALRLTDGVKDGGRRRTRGDQVPGNRQRASGVRADDVDTTGEELLGE